jgi:hypothetical protein
MNGKLSLILTYLHDHPHTILGVSDVRLQERFSEDLINTNYMGYHFFGFPKYSNSVVVVTDPQTNYTPLLQFTHNEPEFTSVALELPKANLIICFVYFICATKRTQGLFQLFENLMASGKSVVIAGDLNASLWPDTNMAGRKLRRFLDDEPRLYLIPNKSPTHNGGRTLDHILVTGTLDYTFEVIDDPLLQSDHRAVSISIPTPVINGTQSGTTRRVTSWKQVVQNFFITYDSDLSINENVNKFYSRLEPLISQYSSNRRPKAAFVPWNEEIADLHHQLKLNPTRDTANTLNNRITTERNRIFNHFAHTRPWKALKSRTRKHTCLLNPSELKAMFMEAYSNADELDEVSLPMAHSFHGVTSIEVSCALQRFKNSTPGSDHLPSNFLNGWKTGVTFLTTLFNNIFQHGIFPDRWKIATLIPLRKPGIQPLYRPISLLPLLSKTLEVLMLARLKTAYQEYIPVNQYALTGGTSLALTKFITSIIANKTTYCIFFDIKRAFDTVKIDTLINNLLPITKEEDLYILRLLRNYLGQRQYVILNSEESFTVCEGVPQGAVLSPFLYALYTRQVFEGIDISTYSASLLTT